MKESYWGYWLIMLGVFVVVIMMLISNVTTQNTEDYYLVKEVTEAAMVDAVNYGYFREYGELKIDAEKFIESFLRRFAENVSLNTYEISFYGIYEAPPKVSVRVKTKSKSFIVAGDSTTFDIVNKVDAILELSSQEGNSSAGSTSPSLGTGTSGSSPTVSTNTYTVTLISDGKTIDTKTVTSGSKINTVGAPSKDGYQFICWESNGTCYDFNNTVTSNITLIAKWEEIKASDPLPDPNTYPFTFNISSGGKPDANPDGNPDKENGANWNSACYYIKNYSGKTFNYVGGYSSCTLSNPVCRYYHGTFDCSELVFNGVWEYHYNRFNWYNANCSATITCGGLVR